MATDYIEKNPPTDADIQAIYDENLPLLVGRAIQGAPHPRRHQRGSRQRNRPAAARIGLRRPRAGTRRRTDWPKRRRVGLVHAGFDAAALRRCGESNDGWLVQHGTRANGLRVPRDPARGNPQQEPPGAGRYSRRARQRGASGSDWTTTSRRCENRPPSPSSRSGYSSEMK